MDDVVDTPIELIAKGTFGAVVKMFGGEGGHYALKIQLVGINKKNDREFDIMHDLQSIKRERKSPCVLKAMSCSRTQDLGHVLSQVSKLERVPGNPSRVYQLIRMELVHGPTLRAYLIAHATLGHPPPLCEIKEIAFQLFWTTVAVQKKLSFRHRDLKPANVILTAVAQEHTYGLGNTTWKTISRVPIPIDFNLSTTLQNGSDKDWRCGTLSYMPPEKMYKISKSGRDEGFEHDPWSLAMMLCSMLLCGRSFGSTTMVGFNENEVFNPERTETIYQLWLPHSEAFKKDYSHLFPDHDWSTIKHAICLSLFQEALGNGAFPVDWPEFENTLLCIGLRKVWREIKSRLGQERTLVSLVPALIVKQVGYDAYDLLKGLLTWNPSNRLSAEEAFQHRFFKTLETTTNPDWKLSNSCANCVGAALHRCSRCQQEYYCSSECSKEDWARHKRTCKEK